MKKLFLFTALFFLATFQSHAQVEEPVFHSCDWIGLRAPVLGFSFYFLPIASGSFVRSTIIPKKGIAVSISRKNIVYDNFRALQYHYPKGVIFCRMENATAKRFGFMLSIHAGGYSDNYREN
jgi:hypothetical protein